MAVAFDATSNLAGFSSGTVSWTHTPVGTPRGILVSIVGDESIDDVAATAVTYGGVTMTEVTGSPQIHATGEVCVVHMFFLGSAIPTGAQTVQVVGTGTSSHSCGAFSYTAAANTEIEDTSTILSDSLANPSVTLTINEDSALAIGFMSGQGAVSGITPTAGWTSRFEEDMGVFTRGYYSKDANVSVDTAAGWTATADDAVAIAAAIKEAGGVSTFLKDVIKSPGLVPWKR